MVLWYINILLISIYLHDKWIPNQFVNRLQLSELRIREQQFLEKKYKRFTKFRRYKMKKLKHYSDKLSYLLWFFTIQFVYICDWKVHIKLWRKRLLSIRIWSLIKSQKYEWRKTNAITNTLKKTYILIFLITTTFIKCIDDYYNTSIVNIHVNENNNNLISMHKGLR